MKINSVIVSAVCAAVLFAGCQSQSARQSWSKDVETALVHRQLERILRCPFLGGDGGKLKVMSIGEIENETTEVSNDNIEFMKSMIASELTNSGVVLISTAVGGAAAERAGKAVAPSLLLRGKLTQRDSADADGRRQCEFIFELSIADVASGKRLWTNRNVIDVRNDGK